MKCESKDELTQCLSITLVELNSCILVSGRDAFFKHSVYPCTALCLNNVLLFPWWMSLCCCDCCFLLWFPTFTVCHHLCVYICVHACQRTKGWWISPCVSCYTQVFLQVCILVVNCVSSGPAQTGAVDQHAETCSVLHRDIFGVLLYCGTDYKRNFLYKTNIFLALGLGGWICNFTAICQLSFYLFINHFTLLQ